MHRRLGRFAQIADHLSRLGAKVIVPVPGRLLHVGLHQLVQNALVRALAVITVKTYHFSLPPYIVTQPMRLCSILH